LQCGEAAARNGGGGRGKGGGRRSQTPTIGGKRRVRSREDSRIPPGGPCPLVSEERGSREKGREGKWREDRVIQFILDKRITRNKEKGQVRSEPG